MHTILTEEDRKKIYDMLADNILTEIQRKYFGREEQKFIGKQLLRAVDKAKSYHELITFLEKFSKKYSFFRPTLVLLSQDTEAAKEKEVINKLESYIKNLKTN